MNSRQKRRVRHAEKMRHKLIHKWGRRLSFLIMRDSPLARELKKRGLKEWEDDGGYSWNGLSRESGIEIEEEFKYGP